MPRVQPQSGRPATIRRKESEAIKDRVSARMPPGSIVRLAASSPPDAGPQLSDGRPNPPHGENGGQTGRPSPATTRQRHGADRESTPSPGVSHQGSRLAIHDPSSPATPDNSVWSSAEGPGRWLDAGDANRHSSWLRRQPAARGTFGATHNLSWGHWRGPQPPGRRPKSAAGSSISGWPPTSFDHGEATPVTTALLAAGALVAGPAGHGQRVTERPEIR